MIVLFSAPLNKTIPAFFNAQGSDRLSNLNGCLHSHDLNIRQSI
ncbi:hypothetical protein QFZ28_003102 [Neobacillus niacini]|nr:hypothetical protein [Neobacillus niacini]MDQ1002702.1 hypothetical protein [Neobacillus niacini]